MALVDPSKQNKVIVHASQRLITQEGKAISYASTSNIIYISMVRSSLVITGLCLESSKGQNLRQLELSDRRCQIDSTKIYVRL